MIGATGLSSALLRRAASAGLIAMLALSLLTGAARAQETPRDPDADLAAAKALLERLRAASGELQDSIDWARDNDRLAPEDWLDPSSLPERPAPDPARTPARDQAPVADPIVPRERSLTTPITTPSSPLLCADAEPLTDMLPRWGRFDIPFAESEAALFEQAQRESASPADQLALARFYFAHRLWREATARTGHWQIEADPEADRLRALIAAVQLDGAAWPTGLGETAACPTGDWPLWRLVREAQQTEALPDPMLLPQVVEALRAYPPAWRVSLALPLFARAVKLENSAASALLTRLIGETELPALEQAQVDYWRGVQAQHQGRAERRDTLWRQVLASEVEPWATRAGLALAEERLRGTASPNEADLARLRGLAVASRYQPFETEATLLLVEGLARAGELLLAFEALEDALLRRAADQPTFPLVSKALSLFEAIYRDGAIADLQSFQVLWPYLGLLPPNARGDAIRVAVAQRLLDYSVITPAVPLLREVAARREGELQRRATGLLMDAHVQSGDPRTALDLWQNAGADPALFDGRTAQRLARQLAARGETIPAVIRGVPALDNIASRADRAWRKGDLDEAATLYRRMLFENPTLPEDAVAAVALNRLIAHGGNLQGLSDDQLVQVRALAERAGLQEALALTPWRDPDAPEADTAAGLAALLRVSNTAPAIAADLTQN